MCGVTLRVWMESRTRDQCTRRAFCSRARWDSAPLSIPERTGRTTIFVTPPVGAFSTVGIGSEGLEEADQLRHPFGRTGDGHRLLRRLPAQARDLRTCLLGDERAGGQVPGLQAALVV